jgi:hypothetical protein
MRLMRRRNKPEKGSEAWWQDVVVEREAGMRGWQRESYRAILAAVGVDADTLGPQAKALVMWLAEYVDEVVDAAVELVTAARDAGAAREREHPTFTLSEASVDQGGGIVPVTFAVLRTARERDAEFPAPAGRRPVPGLAAVDVYDADRLAAWYRTRPGGQGGGVR